MAPVSLVCGCSIQCVSHVIPRCCAVSPETISVTRFKTHPCISRRAASIATMSSLFLAMVASTSDKTACGLEFRLTTPDQTVAEAKSVIRDHAQALLDVKSLIESKDWTEAQRDLRKNASYLKQDIYTIIQGKEGSSRPLLRKLYSNLFNNVTKLDYAARDKDVARVWEYYRNITVALNDILDRI